MIAMSSLVIGFILDLAFFGGCETEDALLEFLFQMSCFLPVP